MHLPDDKAIRNREHLRSQTLALNHWNSEKSQNYIGDNSRDIPESRTERFRPLSTASTYGAGSTTQTPYKTPQGVEEKQRQSEKAPQEQPKSRSDSHPEHSNTDVAQTHNSVQTEFPELSTGEQSQQSPEFSSVAHKQQVFRKLQSLKRVRDFLEQYAEGEREFAGIDLREQVLRDVDLREADLSEAKLHGALLEQANLKGANLSRADLRGANLSGANLTGAELVWANLHKVNLRGANLRGADLSGAYCKDADFTGADLGGAILPDGSVLLTSDPSSLLNCLSQRSQS